MFVVNPINNGKIQRNKGKVFFKEIYLLLNRVPNFVWSYTS